MNTAKISNATRERIRIAIAGLSIANIWYQFFVWLPDQWMRTDHDRDMAIYYLAAVNMHRGLPIYHPSSPHYGPNLAPQWYLYPPYLATSLIPFSGHYAIFSRVWYSLMVCCFWLLAYFLARLSEGRTSGMSQASSPSRPAMVIGTMGWGLALAVAPSFYGYTLSAVYRDMSLGNVDPVIWMLFAAAMAFGGNQLMFAVMAMLKPYAVVPWAVYTLHRGIKSAVPSLIMAIAATVATVAVSGVAAYKLWITQALPLAGQGTFDPINWSLSFAVLRALHGLGVWHYTAGPLPAGPKLFLTAASIAGPVLVAYVTRRQSIHMRAMLLFLASMLFAPLCWSTYFIMAYVPIAWCMGQRKAERQAPVDSVATAVR